MTFNARTAAERIVARCRELARATDVEGQTTRTFLSPGMRRANQQTAAWVTEAGLSVHMDAAGNLRGLSRPYGPRIVIGSHLDTVTNAGAFDGVLGVMLGIELAELSRNIVRSYGIEVIAFSEEEGVRFNKPFLGSRAVTGTLDEATLALRDAHGTTVAQAIRDYGLPPEEISAARLSQDVFAYLEVHIEQGPVLESEDRPLAAVTAIAGQTRLRMHFTGQANHAGTTPMTLRHDALAAAAEWIGCVERLALAVPGLVATVGSIEARPGLGNVVPREVTASLDLRHPSDNSRRAALHQLLQDAEHAAAKRGVDVSHTVTMDQAAVHLDPSLRTILQQSATASGYDASPLVSGAGHDAMVIAPCVPTAMLFLRTPGGISHDPSETVHVEDVEAALKTTIEFLTRLQPEERTSA